MAISGRINGIVYKKDGKTIGPYDIWLTWSRTDYSIVNKTSTVKITLYTARNDGYKKTAATDSNPRVKLIIDNQTLLNVTTIGLATTGTSKDSPQTIFENEYVLYHDSDGTYSKSIVASIDPQDPDSYGLGTVSGTLDIDAILSEATLDTLTCTKDSFDGILNYTYTTKDTSLTHTIELSIENSSTPLITDTAPSGTIDLSSYLAKIYEALPNKSSGMLTLTLITKSDTTEVGRSTKTITLSIPDTVQPTITTNSLTLTPTDKALLLQSMNKVRVQASFSPGSGSSIQGYKISINYNGNTIQEVEISTSGSLDTQIGPFSQAGELVFYVSARDARGRWSSTSYKSITCQQYSLPSFSKFEVFRGDEDGTASTDGTYLVCEYLAKYTNINSNGITVKLFLDNVEKTNLTWSNGLTKFSLGENNKTHEVYLTISDKYYSGSNSAVKTVLPAERILNIAPDGKSLAIGKKASQGTGGRFECQWDAKFNGDVTIDGDLTFTGSGLFDMIYPIGSIYMSVNSTSPANLFGGTWEPIKDKFLLAASNTYPVDSTGGGTATLTESNLPSHTHSAESTYSGAAFDIRAGSEDGNGNVNGRVLIKEATNTEVALGGSDTKWSNAFSWSTTAAARNLDRVSINGTVTTTIGNAGFANPSPINIMPSYLAVYMWKRTA